MKVKSALLALVGAAVLVLFVAMRKSDESDDWEAYSKLGAQLAEQGRFAEALEQHDAAARLKPDSLPIKRSRNFDLMRLGRTSEAETGFEALLVAEPSEPMHHALLAEVLEMRGEWAAALPHWEKAVMMSPSEGDYWFGRGITLTELGRAQEAQSSFARGDELAPAWRQSLFSAAWRYATDPSFKVAPAATALQFTRRLIAVDGGANAQTADLYAVALAASGSFDEAVKKSDEAISLAEHNAVDADLLPVLKQHRESFREHHPWREVPQAPAQD